MKFLANSKHSLLQRRAALGDHAMQLGITLPAKKISFFIRFDKCDKEEKIKKIYRDELLGNVKCTLM